jgi:DNA-binding response OmpR family regulator
MAKRILIVDDSPVILAASKHALNEAGFEVETRSGIDELGDKGAEGFDLILMDVQMPELFGDDVAAVLRLERSVKTPIYLFSTLSEDELRERASEARVDGYISKNEGVEHLVASVRRVFAAT